MLIDLILDGREALIVGGGKEAELKALRLLDAKARTTILAPSFSAALTRLATKNEERLRLVRADPTSANVRKAIETNGPRVVFISTGDSRLDEELAGTARLSGGGTGIICVVDDPRLNDFNMPAIAKVGDVRIGVSTGGKSPAMAGILRRKIERAIAPEDVLQVKLQGRIREAAKKMLSDPDSRREFAYKVIADERISALLRKNDYPAARRLAEKMLREASGDA